LEKLRDSEVVKNDALQMFNRTVQFRRGRVLENATTRRKFH
jgi:hypothetical protein